MRSLRWAVVLFGLADLVFTLGYYFQWRWAIDTWPWPMGRLGYTLVSSFLAGATVVILWLGATGEWGAATGATANVGLMNAGAAAQLFQRWQTDHTPGLRNRAIAFALFALANLAVLLWSLRHPIRDRRPADKLLRISFAIFSVVLLYAAIQLLRHSPTIFPWPLDPATSTMYGWLFLGSAVYFIYGSLRPSWHNMRGQLLAFLAYDLVLFPRYIKLLSTVKPGHLDSLRVYIAVLTYSSLLAIWYLFINKKTRGWRIQPATV